MKSAATPTTSEKPTISEIAKPRKYTATQIIPTNAVRSEILLLSIHKCFRKNLRTVPYSNINLVGLRDNISRVILKIANSHSLKEREARTQSGKPRYAKGYKYVHCGSVG